MVDVFHRRQLLFEGGPVQISSKIGIGSRQHKPRLGVHEM